MIPIVMIIFLPLLLPGIINRSKAIMAGRKGQSIFQPYYHFAKLLGKDEVVSSTAGFITRIAPLIALAATLVAALFIPMGWQKSVLGFGGDFVLVLYLLALAKGIMVLAAMDSGSSFEGMGASRELSFTAFLEPAFMLILSALIYNGSLQSLASIISWHSINFHEVWSLISALLIASALYIMLLVEAARVPFDDPNTHLELTMIHEVMILDYSGFSLALIHYTAALKMLIYCSLISNLLIPGSFFWAPLIYFVLLFCQLVSIGLVESLMARFRMNRNLELVLVPVSISLLVMAALIARTLGGW
ncbi:MAG: NADH-quinone oxidoreductase subunit H [Candidatus Cloacimonetes bacterium]|nr:NADH-quinone oxidoreductase subunit H [Candidatus Cloacimonadota bacterium]